MSASVLHTCDGRDHTAQIQPTRSVKLGCGCTKAIGVRCDGTPIEWIATAVCTRHREETAAGVSSLLSPADATPSEAVCPRDEGAQRPARPSDDASAGLGVTPAAQIEQTAARIRAVAGGDRANAYVYVLGRIQGVTDAARRDAWTTDQAITEIAALLDALDLVLGSTR